MQAVIDRHHKKLWKAELHSFLEMRAFGLKQFKTWLRTHDYFVCKYYNEGQTLRFANVT